MIFKFVKFYKADEGVAYAVDAEGHVFRLGPGMRVEHAEALPDGIKEVSAEEWASEHLPISFEIHIAGEEAKERELTPEEKVLDENYRNALRMWQRARADGVARALQEVVAHGDEAFVLEETTKKSYGSPALLAAVAGFVSCGPEPEDPIGWRRFDKKGALADVIRDMIPTVMEIIGQAMSAKGQARVTRTPAPPPRPQGPGQPSPETASYLEQLAAAGVARKNADGTFTVSPDVIERLVKFVRAQVVPPMPAPPEQPAPPPAPATPPAETKP